MPPRALRLNSALFYIHYLNKELRQTREQNTGIQYSLVHNNFADDEYVYDFIRTYFIVN